MASSIGAIPENFPINGVFETPVLSALPAVLFGMRPLYRELIWDADGGFSDDWKDRSSVSGNDTDGYVFRLGRRAYSAAGLALFVDGLASGGGGGGGNVVGPPSSVDGNLVAFNGTTGKILEDSGVSPAGLASSISSGDAATLTAAQGFATTGDVATLASAQTYADTNKAAKTTNLTAGAGLTGGGDLSADRTFNVVAADGSIVVNADSIQVGVISDTNHGSRGGGGLHATVVASGAAGFMSGTDKAKLDALPASAPASTRNLTAGAGLTGGGDLSADRTFNVVANADGSIVVNADDIQVGVITDAQHGSRGGGALHAAATTSTNGFMSAADKVTLAAAVPNTRTITAGAGLVGTGNLSADRTIDVVAADSSIVVNADSIQVGVISDTNHGSRGGGALHAVATNAAAGFMSAQDKARVTALYSYANQTKTQSRAKALQGFANQNMPLWTMEPSNRFIFQGTTAGYAGATGDQGSAVWVMDITDSLPLNMVALRSLSVTLLPQSGHAGLPVGMPSIKLTGYSKSGAATVVIPYTVDTSANVTAYQLQHDLKFTGSVALNPTWRYVLTIEAEGGSNSLTGLQILSVQASVDYLDSLDAMIQGLGPNYWFRADGNTLSGGNVTQILNKATGASDYLTVTGTIAGPSADSALAGAPSLAFNAGQRAGSTLAASAFQFMNDGTGYEAFDVIVPVASSGINMVRATTGTPNTGAQMYFNGTSYFHNDILAAGTTTNGDTVVGTIVPGSAYVVDAFLSSTPSGQPQSGLLSNLGPSAAGTGTGSVSAPGSTLTLGSTASGGLQANMRWAETLIFPFVLTPAQRQQVREYVQCRYGIAADINGLEEKAILAMGPFEWVRSDKTVLSSGKVSAVVDRVRAGHQYTQATSGSQAATPVADATYGGQTPLVFTGVEYYDSNLAAALWTFLHDGTGAEEFVVLNPAIASKFILSTTTSSNQGLNVLTGTNQLIAGANNASGVSAFSGTLTTPLGTTTYINWRHATSASPQYAVSLKGTVGASGAYSTAPSALAAPATRRLGLLAGGGSSNFQGSLAEILTFPRVLSASERTTVQTYINKRYGIAP